MQACEKRRVGLLTVQSAPASGEATSAAGDWFELCRQADRWYSLVPRQRSFQLQQHDVVAGITRRSAVLRHRDHFDHSDTLRVLVWFTQVMHTDHDHIVFVTRPETVPQHTDYAVYTRSDRRRNGRRNCQKSEQPVAATIASCIHYFSLRLVLSSLFLKDFIVPDNKPR